jgi:chemotaxis response regulator CheB
VNAGRADPGRAPRPSEPALRARVVLVTSDPVFAALSKRALEEAPGVQLVVAVSAAELLETARQVAPDFLVVDVDGEDAAALKTLVAKVMLVSDAPVVLVSAYLAPGSPRLGALLQSIAATFVQKPQGPSSLSLADEDGPPFVAALQAAFAGHEGESLAADDLDAGWSVEDLGAASSGRGGAAHD